MYLSNCCDANDPFGRTRSELIVPFVTLCQIGDASQAVVDEYTPDP